jgi:hypothetical protein
MADDGAGRIGALEHRDRDDALTLKSQPKGSPDAIDRLRDASEADDRQLVAAASLDLLSADLPPVLPN